MKIYISGGTKKLRDLAQDFVEHCANIMLSEHTQQQLEIDLEFSKKLLKEDGILAEMDFEDKNHRPKEFSITVDITGPLRRTLESIAHEMVHVKQYASGEMIEMEKTGRTKWKNRYISDRLNYWNRPWEIEAHGRELGLFITWAEKNKLGSEAWTQEYHR